MRPFSEAVVAMGTEAMSPESHYAAFTLRIRSYVTLKKKYVCIVFSGQTQLSLKPIANGA